jgi:hypothetical protein
MRYAKLHGMYAQNTVCALQIDPGLVCCHSYLRSVNFIRSRRQFSNYENVITECLHVSLVTLLSHIHLHCL